MPGQTVQTQIRLLLQEQSDQVFTVCHSICIVWTHCSMVEPHSSNFRVITSKFLGVRIFRKFTVSFQTDRSGHIVYSPDQTEQDLQSLPFGHNTVTL